jgi:threonyl-tRNA synthetase
MALGTSTYAKIIIESLRRRAVKTSGWNACVGARTCRNLGGDRRLRILQLHSNFLEYEPIRKEIRSAEDAEKKAVRFEEVVVLFTSIEKGDNDAVAKKAIEDTRKYLDQIKANRIFIYPYAHLSTDLAQSTEALKVLKGMESYARELGIETYRAPFGWNKQFTISIKGHPLAEQSRSYSAETSTAVEVKPVLKKEYLILTEEGTTYSPEDYSYKPEETNFRLLVEKEALGSESKAKGEPEYIRHMKKFGIDWEAMSDIGHMHYSPEAAFIYESVAEYSAAVADSLRLPVYRVKGTNMFNLDLPPVREHAELFGDRLYRVDVENRSFVLRYAACHQQFAIIRHWLISYRNLPFGAFEVADSYRLEQSGELLLSFRVRRMNMPDLHVFCRDIEEAEEWFFKLHEKIYEEIGKLGRDYYSLYNLTSRHFFEENKEWFKKLVKREGKPVLLCFYPPGINYYWVLNIEYHIIDMMNRPREIGTVQIDVGNAKRFGIKYVDSEGKDNYPVILHSALIGTIERYLYTLFDSALRMKHPSLPSWANPTQVRIIPVSSEYLSYAEALADTLEQVSIRVDVDDRELTVGNKVREAEMMWIPYIAIVGKKEVENVSVSLRSRADEGQRAVTVSQLSDIVTRDVQDKPRLPSHLPRLLSMRPKFA